MAAVSSYMPTLVDITRAMAPDGSIAKIAEVLQQYNDILDDIPWIEGNLPTGHQISYRTSKPTPTLRLLNAGVVPNKSTTGQTIDNCAILESRSHIDVDVANLNGNTQAFRFSQDKGIIEGMGDELSRLLIYGDTSVTPEEFNGLDSRYATTSQTTVGGNVISAGVGGSDNTSIWLVCWAPEKVFGIYPKGSKAGLTHEDRGIQDVLVDYSTNAYMRAYVSWYQWKCGIAIADWRYVVRIGNIDVSNLLTAGDSSDSSANILKYMSKAIDLLPPGGNYKPVFYMNNTVRSMLRVKLMDKSNFALAVNDVMSPSGIGRKELTFFGIPCRRVDSIVNTESTMA